MSNSLIRSKNFFPYALLEQPRTTSCTLICNTNMSKSVRFKNKVLLILRLEIPESGKNAVN